MGMNWMHESPSGSTTQCGWASICRSIHTWSVPIGSQYAFICRSLLLEWEVCVYSVESSCIAKMYLRISNTPFLLILNGKVYWKMSKTVLHILLKFGVCNQLTFMNVDILLRKYWLAIKPWFSKGFALCCKLFAALVNNFMFQVHNDKMQRL